MPVEPPPSRWDFADLSDPALDATLDDLVGMGADLEPGTLLAAYRRGLFPMPGERQLSRRRQSPFLWFCPVQRGVLPLDGLRVTKSLRRSVRDFEIRIDTAFDEVMDACGDPRRPQGWIDERIKQAYGDLHRLGWAHSVEAWREGRLAGGLYGVSIGGLFAGESMFHHERDASKVALVGLVSRLTGDGVAGRLLDVQWSTPHLASLGVVEVPRRDYLDLLRAALELPDAFAGRGQTISGS